MGSLDGRIGKRRINTAKKQNPHVSGPAGRVAARGDTVNSESLLLRLLHLYRRSIGHVELDSAILVRGDSSRDIKFGQRNLACPVRVEFVDRVAGDSVVAHFNLMLVF